MEKMDHITLPNLKPVIVLGTGFLRQIREDSITSSKDEHSESPLIDWCTLIKDVAKGVGLVDRISPELARVMPTVCWDDLVRSFAIQQEIAAHQAERKLRRLATETLSNAEGNFKHNQERLKSFHEVCGKHVISLNFDSVLMRDLSSPPVSVEFRKSTKTYGYISGERFFWFPHGLIDDPNSIILGQREYGKLPKGWSDQFDRFKALERPKTISSSYQEDHSSVNEQLADLIRHLMHAPLLMYGVGLGPAEWGLWWLLNQRARNLVKIPQHRWPPVYLYKQIGDNDLKWLLARPALVEPVIVNSWDCAWQRFLNDARRFGDMVKEEPSQV